MHYIDISCPAYLFPRVGSNTTSSITQSIHDQKPSLFTFIFDSKFSFQHPSMAALSVNHPFYYKNSSVQELKSKRRNFPRCLVVLSCQNNEPTEKSKSTTTKKEQKEKRQIFAGLQKFGRGLKETMSPQQKGDWKDLMLMSFSFAVYVYMSQKIVCAYFAWMSMPKQSW
ncbi:hypothetical protein DITRI_Ditri13aG0005700 [Diplodiscus trichospermus]